MMKQMGKEECKKLFWILLCTLFLAFTTTHEVRAEYKSKVYTYNDFKYSYDDKTGYIWIRAYTGGEKEVRIPSQINGVPVKYVASLQTKAENGKPNKRITKVYFPDGIKYIEGMSGCSALRSVRIPNSVKEIGYGAFQDCRKLESIKLPKNLKIIGSNAFSGCDRLKKIKFPKGLKSIGMGAFDYCESLTEISIPNSVTYLGESAFSCCKKLQKVKLPNKLTVIREDTFAGCKKLKSVTIPKKVTQIEAFAFSGCSSLSKITIPSKVESIDEYAFLQCKKLKSVTFKGTKVQYIGEDAFGGIYSKVVFFAPEQSVKTYKELLMSSQSTKEGEIRVVAK